MNKTMKTTAGLLAFVVLLGAGWTEVAWYIGKRAQRASVALIDSANEQLHAALPGVPLAIETESYDRGLFSSHARYVLQVRPPMLPGVLKPPSGAYALAWINVDIEHGPYPLRPAGSLDGKPGARGGAALAASRIAIDIKGAPALAAVLNLPQPLSLVTLDGRYDYHGGIDFQWRMPPLRSGTQSPAQGQFINWHGATGKGRLEPAGALRMTANIDGLTLNGNGTAGEATATPSTALTDLALTVDLAASGAILPRPGTVTLDVKRWRNTYLDDRATVQPWEARDLHWRSLVAMEDGGLALDVDYRVGGLRIGPDELGLGSGHVRLEHLDSVALTRTLNDLHLLGSAFVFGQASSKAITTIVADLSRAGVTLLQHQPRLTLAGVTWQSPRGDKAALDTSVQMGPKPDRTLNVDPLWGVLDMMRGFDLKANVPGAMLRDFPTLRARLRDSGMFVMQGADMVAAIHAAEDSAVVNGKAMTTTQWLTPYAGPRPRSITLPPLPDTPGPPLLGMPGDMLQPDLLTPQMLNLDGPNAGPHAGSYADPPSPDTLSNVQDVTDGLQDAAAPALPDGAVDSMEAADAVDAANADIAAPAEVPEVARAPRR
ncbi:YdgA family protein [Bordetella sp. N]|uniref:YdgA family protein n=1 Tax=Bordetella sp. N TaxID=1746199 RepID=UPI00070DF8AB|nr:DUF945 family protein [Bordetella sp. N]ALM86312.1 hypothetical protein ASB57_28270 [Bordetella sp. N]